MSTLFKCQKHFYFKLFSLVKQFLFQTIQFNVNTQLNVKTVLYQVIQLSINTQFSSIRPIERTLSGATTRGQSGSGADMAMKEYTTFLKAPALLEPRHHIVCHIHDTSYRRGLTPLQKCSWCIL